MEIVLLEKKLTQAYNEFIKEFTAIDQSKIHEQIKPGTWTPAQIAWHIVMATGGLPDTKTKPLNREVDSLLPAIRPWWEDLTQKFTSPEFLAPDNEHRTKNEILSALNRACENNIHVINHEDLTLLCLDTELPTVGYLTRYEWLWFHEMHLKRHVFQLRNIYAPAMSE